MHIKIQCVHRVPSGFWKIVVCKQIELATCGLWQIIRKSWKWTRYMFFVFTMTLIENTERHCHMLVTRHGIWIYCFIYWMLITCNCKWYAHWVLILDCSTLLHCVDMTLHFMWSVN
jgi:hypothetical protein